jgi:hypothetical protein
VVQTLKGIGILVNRNEGCAVNTAMLVGVLMKGLRVVAPGELLLVT